MFCILKYKNCKKNYLFIAEGNNHIQFNINYIKFSINIIKHN